MGRPALTGDTAEINAKVARACPRSTSATEEKAILSELEKLDGMRLLSAVDHLATEWERLNDGTKACGGADVGTKH